MLAWVDAVIRGLSSKKWHGWLANESMSNTRASDQARLRQIIFISEIAARNHLCTMNCLRRSIAQKKMLVRRNINARLHIGVRKSEQGYQAHAWLTAGGEVINDTPDVGSRYVELENENWREGLKWIQ
ncbi:MAG: hypothetical protein FD130_726 [Halothiobacillaceae bacterium]|nr:MAG: hypothetical protein FD130_726 [Halothiobacillaceae bacterium]